MSPGSVFNDSNPDCGQGSNEGACLGQPPPPGAEQHVGALPPLARAEAAQRDAVLSPRAQLGAEDGSAQQEPRHSRGHREQLHASRHHGGEAGAAARERGGHDDRAEQALHSGAPEGRYGRGAGL